MVWLIMQLWITATHRLITASRRYKRGKKNEHFVQLLSWKLRVSNSSQILVMMLPRNTVCKCQCWSTQLYFRRHL